MTGTFRSWPELNCTALQSETQLLPKIVTLRVTPLMARKWSCAKGTAFILVGARDRRDFVHDMYFIGKMSFYSLKLLRCPPPRGSTRDTQLFMRNTS